MASPIEEDFIKNEIIKLSPKKIFEFGCGNNLFTNNVSDLGHHVTAIDLYKRDNLINFNFIQSDFVTYDFKNEKFDLIYALSSFEHIGMEQDGILADEEILKKIDLIIIKMKSMLIYEGILLITIPFGISSKFYVNKEGKWDYHRRHDSVWGSKIYDLNDIDSTFKDFDVVKSEFYIRIGCNFFDRQDWIMTSPENCYVSKENTDAIACLKFINHNIYR